MSLVGASSGQDTTKSLQAEGDEEWWLEERRLQRELSRLRDGRHLLKRTNDQLKGRLQQRSSLLRDQKDYKGQLLHACADLERANEAKSSEVTDLRWRVSALRDAAKAAAYQGGRTHADLLHLRTKLPGIEHFADPRATGLTPGAAHGLRAEVPSAAPRGAQAPEREIPEGYADRTAAMSELREVLEGIASGSGSNRYRCFSGAGWGWIAALLLGLCWSALLCRTLDAFPGQDFQWSICAATLLLAAMVLACQTMWLRHLNSKARASDEYDLNANSEQSPVPLHDDAEMIAYHRDVVVEPYERLLAVSQRPSFCSGAALALATAVYVCLFVLRRPLSCAWTQLEVQNGMSGEYAPFLGGNVDCKVDRTWPPMHRAVAAVAARLGLAELADSGAAWARPQDTAVSLVLTMPVLWAALWYSCAVVSLHRGARVLFDCTDRREELLLSRTTSGLVFFDLVMEWLWSRAQTLLWLQRLVWWVGWQLFLDGIDCVDLWRALAFEPRLLAARTPGATHGDGLLDDHVARSNATAATGLLWVTTVTALCVGMSSVAVSPYFHALWPATDELRVTEENRHKVFVLYMRRQLPMPGRNWRSVLRCSVSLLTVDIPFLLVRIAVAVSLHVPPSPMATKNAACIVYYMRTLLRLRSWRNRTRALRHEHARVVKAFEHELDAVARYSRETGGPLLVYERVGGALDRMMEPEAEFFEAYSEEYHGIPVAAAAASDAAEHWGQWHSGWAFGW
mmetsp:Transcript_112956/g.319436  ORF Transcript_112956/g.319436 Transcript_112956/m.319436 type:complete len:738 (-) Transcript_112956:156-2369(-)